MLKTISALPGRLSRVVAGWFVVPGNKDVDQQKNADRVDWLRVMPYLAIHLMCFGVIWVGFSWVAFWTAFALYALRVFALTAFYHRYFSHRAFKTSRVCQFIFGVLGCSAVERGPIWWAAHHRHHHQFSDEPEDLHSPRQHGFWRSHVAWFLTPRGLQTNHKMVPDLLRYWELRMLDRFDSLVPIMLGVALFFFGYGLNALWPDLGTSGMQMLVWGLFISTVVTYHVTYMVNSLAHVVGRRRYDTKDDSRNSFLIALFTFGEGWHNNHHHFPSSARQGFFWWEVDFTYYILKVMSWTGIIWDLKPVPERVKYNQGPAYHTEPKWVGGQVHGEIGATAVRGFEKPISTPPSEHSSKTAV